MHMFHAFHHRRKRPTCRERSNKFKLVVVPLTLWLVLLWTPIAALTVGECMVALGVNDVDNSGGLNATEFAQAAQSHFVHPQACNVSNSTTLVDDLLQVYWNGIFLQAACTCQDYDDRSCCNQDPIVYRPGHYSSGQYTYTVCAILDEAVSVQCEAISANTDDAVESQRTSFPTSSPVSFVVSAPTASPTSTGSNGDIPDSVILSIPDVVKSNVASTSTTDPWLVAVWVIVGVTCFSLVLTALMLWRRWDHHDAVTVAKGTVVSRQHVMVEASCTSPDEFDDLEHALSPSLEHALSPSNVSDDSNAPTSPESHVYRPPYPWATTKAPKMTDLMFDSSMLQHALPPHRPTRSWSSRSSESSQSTSRSEQKLHVFRDDSSSSQDDFVNCSGSSMGSFTSLGLVIVDHDDLESTDDDSAQHRDTIVVVNSPRLNAR